MAGGGPCHAGRNRWLPGSRRPSSWWCYPVLRSCTCSSSRSNVHGVPGGYSIPVVALTIADAVALVILQLRHSWPSRGIARPRGWPVTLFLQAILTYALVPLTGWHPLIMLGFLAGSALLLVPAAPGWAAFAAVIATLPVLFAVKPIAGLSTGRSGWAPWCS